MNLTQISRDSPSQKAVISNTYPPLSISTTQYPKLQAYQAVFNPQTNHLTH